MRTAGLRVWVIKRRGIQRVNVTGVTVKYWEGSCCAFIKMLI